MSRRLVATTPEGRVCSRWSGQLLTRTEWTFYHHEHGCTVSPLLPHEPLPKRGEHWTPPAEREAQE